MIRRYRYRQLTFAVHTASPSDQDWLTEFLQPAFDVRSGEGPADVRVSLMQDDERFRRILARGAAVGAGGRDAFALDNSVIRLPVWDAWKDGVTLYEQKASAFLHRSADRRTVCILAPAGVRSRVPLMRVLREYAMNEGILGGGVFFHASAAAFDERALLIVGTKNAGKTSMLTHFLRHTSASYLSNDRVFLSQEAQGPLIMHGMPTIATIRSAMLPHFPGLARQLDASTYHHHLTLEECKHRTEAVRAWSDGRYGLTPAQFTQLHESTAVARAVPGALLFPRVSAAFEGLEAVALNTAQVERRVADTLFGADTLRMAADVFSLRTIKPPTAEELLLRCRQVIASLPCYEVRIGAGAYQSPQATDRLLRQVLP